MRRLAHPLIVILLLATSACAASTGGGAGGGAATDPLAPFIGTWSGTFEATVGGGDMGLELVRGGEGLTGRLTLDIMGETITSPIAGFSVEGNRCSFLVSLEGADVEFEALLDGGSMAGTMVAWVEGQEVGSGEFVLTRKPD